MRKYISSPNYLKQIGDEIFHHKRKVIAWENLFRHHNYFKQIDDEKCSSQKISVCVRKIILSPNILILREKICFVTKLLEKNRWRIISSQKESAYVRKFILSPNLLKFGGLGWRVLSKPKLFYNRGCWFSCPLIWNYSRKTLCQSKLIEFRIKVLWSRYFSYYLSDILAS